MTEIPSLLQRVLDADRVLRDARDAFLSQPDTDILTKALAEQAQKDLPRDDDPESVYRLIRLCDLLEHMTGPAAAKLLVDILGHEEPAVRTAAGEALIELLYDRYAEVAKVLENVADDPKTKPTALAEIPFILAEVGEPGGVRIVSRLLKHKRAEVVGAAIESLATFGDAQAARFLEPLKNDRRTVRLDEEDEESAEVTLGELAKEAIQHLRGLGGE